MSAVIRRLIGLIKVTEVGNLIHVDGINTQNLISAFSSIWHTSKIADNIFTHQDGSSFSFNRFFAPDMLYVMGQILEQRPRGISVRGIQRTIELIQTETWIKDTLVKPKPFLKRELLKRFIYSPLPHQIEFFDHYEDSVPRFGLNGYLLAAQPGAGKTLMGLMIGEMLESDVNIFIVPNNSVDLVWKDSFKKLYKSPPKFWVSSMEGDPKPGCRNYAFHYERLDQALTFLKRNWYKRVMIWLDESHNLNEITSQRTLLFLELCAIADRHGVKNIIWASGTPVKAMGREVVPLLQSIDPLFDEDAEKRFIGIFGKSTSRALDVLNARIGRVTHITLKEAFRPSKPIFEDIRIKIPNGHDYTLDSVRAKMKAFIEERMKFYEKNMHRFVRFYEECVAQHKLSVHSEKDKQDFLVYRKYIETIRTSYDPMLHKDLVKYCNHYETTQILPSLHQNYRADFKEAKTVVKYYYLKVQGEALGRILGQLRDQCVVDMVPHCKLPDYIDESEKKTLIFTTAVGAVKAAFEHLTDEGYTPMMVYGETNKDLPDIIKQFGENDNVNPVVATYASLSTAVPLTMANTCLMLNAPFRDYIYNQAISRVDRIGQNSQVYVYNFFLDTGDTPNISTRSNDILEWCRKQVEEIMGKPASIEEGSVVALECFQELGAEWAQSKATSNTVTRWT